MVVLPSRFAQSPWECAKQSGEKGRASLRGKEMRREGGSEESEEKSRKMVPLASSLLCELRDREREEIAISFLFL